jgi:hypothetical protein
MRPRPPLALVLVVLALGAAGAVAAVDPGGGAPALAAQERPTPDNGTVVIRIEVDAEGNADWTVASGIPLDGDTDEAAFRSLVADLRNGTATAGAVGYSVESYRSFADRVERSVDRSADMRIESPEWRGRVVGDTGVVSLSFTWTEFARLDGDRVVLGDVFESGEAWFSGLDPDQRLVIAGPPGYELDSSEIAAPFDDGTFFIDGPTNLTAMNVSVVYEPSVARTPTSTGTTTPTPNGSDPDDGATGGSGVLLLGGLLVVVAAAAAVAYAVSTDGFGGDPAAGAAGSTDGGTAPDAGDPQASPGGTPDGGGSATDAAAGTDPASAPDAPNEAGAAAGAGTSADSDDGTDGDGEGTDPIEEELLSDEERVERLLEANGGRMKQANIVSETGWSNAKVSQLLSSMDEADRIDKLRIGRENLITLPDEDVGELE